MTGNILAVQLGGAAPMLNAALAGVVNGALNQGGIEEIYGVTNGLQGLMNEELIDLAEESQQVIRGLSFTPGVAMGGGSGLPQNTQDWERIIDVLQAQNIRYLVIIGDIEAVDAAARIDESARACAYALNVVAIPVCPSNEIPMTDHCIGYGTTIKDFACVLSGIALKCDAEGAYDLVSIVEASGKDSGWIAAGATIGHRRNQADDPPQIVLLPERPVDRNELIFRVQQVLKDQRFCLIVTGENLTDPDGNYLTSIAPTDPLAAYAGGSVTRVLAGMIEQGLGSGIRIEEMTYRPLHDIAALTASQTDHDEALMCGESAVEALVAGHSGKMVALKRGDNDFYASETTLVGLAEVIDRKKTFPDNWVGDDGMSINYQFFKYANPLIQGELEVPFDTGLPKYISILGNRVERQLPSHNMA